MPPHKVVHQTEIAGSWSMANVNGSEDVRSWWSLAWFGWCYVAAVAAIAVFAFTSPASDTNTVAFLALPLLTLPLGPVAILPAYLIPALLGDLLGVEPDSVSWLVGIAFTCVWMATAWTNAQVVQAALRMVGRRRARLADTSKETASR
jgi:hypothetical protein